MFRRPTDPKEHNYMMALPCFASIGMYFTALSMGYPLQAITEMTYLFSAVSCIAALGGLANQKTARMGNALGILGISSGVVGTLGLLGMVNSPIFIQWAAMVN